MIDFRYHLVSLISVFLALAVGIVLGAGPLRENLGDQLAGQVEQLRTEQEQLRGDTEELSAKHDQLSSFIAELGPELVAGTLDGKQVAVLTDDSSTRPATERIVTLLDAAGVGSTVQITLLPALWAPDAGPVRAEAVQTVRSIAPAVLPVDPQAELTDNALLSAMIPTLLRGDVEGGVTPELRTQLWQVLLDNDLVSIDGEVPATVDGVIYAGAAPEELADANEDEQVATERAQGLLTSQTSLLGELDHTDLPTVVSAATPGNDASTGVLRTVRGDSGFDALSTTDRLQEADGPLLSVLALIEQTRGGSGAYGTTGDAEDRLPALPETSGLEEQAAGQEGDGGTAETEAGTQPSDGGGEG